MRDITQRDIKNLQKLFVEARERLLDTIINYKGIGTKTYANTILRQLQRELKLLQKKSDEFIQTDIPEEYRKSLRDTYNYFRRARLMMKAPSAFASIHTDALYEIAREMQYQISDGLATVGRQVLRYVDNAQDEALRAAGLHQTGVKIASGDTIENMQGYLIDELNNGGFMTVQYGSGKNARQVPVDVYAGMVARSTTREAGNTARLTQMTVNGYDLVKMTKHYPTCAVCATLQGRVYSISGNDKRFPPLSKAFGQYNNMHPNCRHVAAPWVEALQSPEEVQEALKNSNRPFKDTRSSEEVALYNSHQSQGRKLRNDLYQYERYKEALGEHAPKSVASFRRMKYNNSERWNQLQREYKMINRIDKNEGYSPEYREKLKETYSFFKDNGFELTEHAINRVLGQKTGRGKQTFTREDALEVLRMKPNYTEEGSRSVKFYNGIAVVQGDDTGEVISIVVRNSIKSGWEEKK